MENKLEGFGITELKSVGEIKEAGLYLFCLFNPEYKDYEHHYSVIIERKAPFLNVVSVFDLSENRVTECDIIGEFYHAGNSGKGIKIYKISD